MSPASTASGTLRRLGALALASVALFFVVSTAGADNPVASGKPAHPRAEPPHASAEGLPILSPKALGWVERAPRTVNLLSLETLLAGVGDGGKEGLRFDLSAVRTLLDGTPIDPAQVNGVIWIAPYPVGDDRTRAETAQYRRGAAVRSGRAELRFSDLENGPGWVERGQILLRAQLSLSLGGADRDLGVYEFQAGFRREDGSYRRCTTITEGPFVGFDQGEPSSNVVIWLSTEPPAPVRLIVQEADDLAGSPATGDRSSAVRPPPRERWGRPASNREADFERPTRIFDRPACGRHEIEVGDLRPDRTYSYVVQCDGWVSGPFRFRTAPRPGEGTVRFAFAGDSRQGPGGGARAFMGVNAQTLGRLFDDARAQGVCFWVHGGDLVSGYTTSVADFRSQLRAFQWIATPFLRERPLFCLMGNHDSVVRVFENGTGGENTLDRWPYATESSEAIFADAFVQPTNGPEPDDPRRPSYRETVYAFTYGPVRVIALNNNYWVASDPGELGGSPEGYLFADQLRWLARELHAAEADPAVRYVFLCLQEPPLPNSAHLDDAMWYEGDTRVRASAQDEGDGLAGEPIGVIEGRNEVLRLATAGSKAVAILAGDEHNYSRTLLTPRTPAGEPSRDDRDMDGRLDPPLSPVAGLRRPIWCLISGGAGAPHYSESPSPWNLWWKEHPPGSVGPEGGYRFSMQNHWLLFEADARHASLEVRSVTGEVIDRVDDLGQATQRK